MLIPTDRIAVRQIARIGTKPDSSQTAPTMIEKRIDVPNRRSGFFAITENADL